MSLESALDIRRTKCAHSGASALRVAILCDFLEEEWPSMNLVADMLSRNLREHCSSETTVTKIRPKFRRRFGSFPLLPAKLANNADRWQNRFTVYPAWLRGERDNYDVFHIVDHSYSQLVHSLPAGRAVVTCHDLDTFRCLLTPEHDARPFWFRAMTRRILSGFQQAAHVIAVSAATRDELFRQNLFPTDRISVISNGVHPAYSHVPEAQADQAAAKILPPGDGPLLLSVGSTIARKRLDVLFRIFKEVHRERPDVKLIRVGGLAAEHERLARELGIRDAISIIPFLETDILAAVYRRSALLLHTSEAEGFGLPIVEAMASGCPVVANDIPVLREVGGTAAAFCPIEEIRAWKDKILRLLGERAEEPEKWELHRQRGFANAARFSWAENAKQTLRVYQKLAENRA